MARTVADCALLQNVIAGPHPFDAHSLRPLVTVPTESESIANMRIALAVNLGDWAVEPEVQTNTRAVGDALQEEGAIVEEVEVGITRDEVDRATVAHFGTIFGRAIADEIATHGELLTPYARDFAERFRAAGDTFLEGMAIEAAIYAKIAPLLERCDVLICPTAGFAALVAGEDYIDAGMMVDGEQVDPMRDSIMTLAFNILSNCPVLAIPSGWASDNVPRGVQIVGRTFDDATVFRVGAALERARPWGYHDLLRLPTFTGAS